MHDYIYISVNCAFALICMQVFPCPLLAPWNQSVVILLPSLLLSHFLYPTTSMKTGDGGDEASSSKDGKYELLSVANSIIAEEIKNLMSKSRSKTQ